MQAAREVRIEPRPIADAAAELDRALVDWRRRDRWTDAWLEPAQAWSEAVWQRAVQLGPLAIDSVQIAGGERVARAPVYVCGAPRSGTTLVRDLLDGHPELAALPSEGRFFEEFGQRRESDLAVNGQRWLRQLANPNHQEPFWLLGQGRSDDSRYVRFARAMMTWNAALAGHDFGFRLQPVVALALAGVAGQSVAALRRSVDKTPGYEFHLKAIWTHYPDAKVIQVVRHPAAIAASYSEGLSRNKVDSTPVARILRNVTSSYIAGWRAARFAPRNRFLVVRYEDLVEDRAREMGRVASFLGVDWDDCLIRQTIMGRGAEPNSSFHGLARRSFDASNASERIWLALAALGHAIIARQARPARPDRG